MKSLFPSIEDHSGKKIVYDSINIITKEQKFDMIIVSACLMGINCRYDGANRLNMVLISILSKDVFMPVCPEQLGGLQTPRLPAQIVSGTGKDVLNGRSRLLDSSGTDVTEHFIRGANEVLNIAKLMKVETAFMKEYSPSCGVNHIKRNGVNVEGMGVASSLLSAEGINIISSENLDEEYVRYYCNRKRP